MGKVTLSSPVTGIVSLATAKVSALFAEMQTGRTTVRRAIMRPSIVDGAVKFVAETLQTMDRHLRWCTARNEAGKRCGGRCHVAPDVEGIPVYKCNRCEAVFPDRMQTMAEKQYLPFPSSKDPDVFATKDKDAEHQAKRECTSFLTDAVVNPDSRAFLPLGHALFRTTTDELLDMPELREMVTAAWDGQGPLLHDFAGNSGVVADVERDEHTLKMRIGATSYIWHGGYMPLVAEGAVVSQSTRVVQVDTAAPADVQLQSVLYGLTCRAQSKRDGTVDLRPNMGEEVYCSTLLLPAEDVTGLTADELFVYLPQHTASFDAVVYGEDKQLDVASLDNGWFDASAVELRTASTSVRRTARTARRKRFARKVTLANIWEDVVHTS